VDFSSSGKFQPSLKFEQDLHSCAQFHQFARRADTAQLSAPISPEITRISASEEHMRGEKNGTAIALEFQDDISALAATQRAAPDIGSASTPPAGIVQNR